MLRDRYVYYKSVCRSVGVPPFFLDDAAQDLALALWLEGKEDDVLAIRRSAIDAVRRYGPHTRYGQQRPAMMPLSMASGLTAPESALVARMDVYNAARTLSPMQRRAMRRRLAGLPMVGSDSTHASAARKRLRAALAV